MGVPPAQSLVDAGDIWSASIGLAATAVALRRFRLDHGTYPRALDELAPIYLKTVPLDPFADRPPTYVRQGVGFELRADLPARYRGPMGEWTLPR